MSYGGTHALSDEKPFRLVHSRVWPFHFVSHPFERPFDKLFSYYIKHFKVAHLWYVTAVFNKFISIRFRTHQCYYSARISNKLYPEKERETFYLSEAFAKQPHWVKFESKRAPSFHSKGERLNECATMSTNTHFSLFAACHTGQDSDGIYAHLELRHIKNDLRFQ